MTELAGLPSGRPRRLVYFGTPAMAVPTLEVLVASGFEVALVVTRVDKRRGRGGHIVASPVKQTAQRLGLPVSHLVEDALTVDADLGIVVAFGQLIKSHVLARLPMVNVHFSLLPRWRGAAPVERALLAGDAMTGVCLMQLDEGLDTGPVLDVVEVPIGTRETVADLRERLVSSGSECLVAALTTGFARARAQVGEPTYAAKLTADEFAIDWTRSAAEIDRLVRLGVAYSYFRGKRLKILSSEVVDGRGDSGTFIDPGLVTCGSGALALVRVQPEGKSSMDADSWANGARPNRGERFTTMVKA